MTAERGFAPRRTPRQKRSRIVFDKIIGSAKALFEQEGYAYVSTNQIAEKAGVSIGSLYQYFANRESIALAVFEEASSRAALTIKRRAVQNLGAPLEESIAKGIVGVFEVFERDRYSLFQLMTEVPALQQVAKAVSFENLVRHTTQTFLEQHFPTVDRDVLARTAYIVDACVIGAVARYLEERPDVLSREQAVAELITLVQRYTATLQRPRRSARRRPVR